MSTWFFIGVLPGEVPFDGSLFLVAALLPGSNFRLQYFEIGNAPIQALATEDR